MANKKRTPEQERESNRVRMAAWRKANPERIRAIKRKSRAKHRDRNRQAMREWHRRNKEAERQYRQLPERKQAACDSAKRAREKNPEKALARERDYRARNRKEMGERARERRQRNIEAARAKERAWTAKNPERMREKYLKRAAKYPEKIAESARNQKAQRRGAPGHHTGRDIARLFEQQAGHCAGCRILLIKTGKGRYHVDHIMPVSRGGSNWPENLQILCPTCNHRKKDKHPDEWAKIIGSNGGSCTKRNNP